MKHKILAIFISILFLVSIGASASTYSGSNYKKQTSTMDDNAPTWSLGNSWTYDINTIEVQVNESGQTIELSLAINDLVLEVTSETPTAYVLDLSGDISGSFAFDDGAGMTLGGSLYFTRLSGVLNVLKDNLTASREFIVINSIALLTDHPIPIPLPLPIPLKITIEVDHPTPRPFIGFPLFDGKVGLISGVEINANIKVESIVLVILNLINPEIPSEIVIDQTLGLPDLLYDAALEEISVTAGTYDAYKLNFFEGLLGSLHYAPVAGNLIKAQAELDVSGSLYLKFEGELKSTNYS
jgi:hypothetical protein